MSIIPRPEKKKGKEVYLQSQFEIKLPYAPQNKSSCPLPVAVIYAFFNINR